MTSRPALPPGSALAGVLVLLVAAYLFVQQQRRRDTSVAPEVAPQPVERAATLSTVTLSAPAKPELPGPPAKRMTPEEREDAFERGRPEDLVFVHATAEWDTYELGEAVRIFRVFENPTDAPIEMTEADWRQPRYTEVILTSEKGSRLYKPPQASPPSVTIQPHAQVKNTIDVELPTAGTWTIEMPPAFRARRAQGAPKHVRVTVLDQGNPTRLEAKAMRLAEAIATEDDSCPTCWTPAQQDLARMGAALSPLLQQWLRSAEVPHVRAVSAKILGRWVRQGDAGRDALLAGLRDTAPRVRSMCVRALAPASDRREIEAVLPLLRDADTEVRVDTIRALASAEDARVVAALVTALKDEEAWVRQRAAVALGERGNAAGIDELIATLRDDSAHGPVMVVEALETLTGRSFGTPELPGLHSNTASIEKATVANKSLVRRWLAWWADEGRERFDR